ncbi:S-layer homology domain-containing protein [Cohnella phaseoli]|uniref:S-layer family protein n=1 Tax=Cohnella phaseoli TaxID=456490 RepID=A0A3D9JQ30_9BACL|nr:S-layer homology domain-containing protein [Cohnella phaseoli]RED76132.1 S-layer family protein [Cohnella phaseoli]
MKKLLMLIISISLVLTAASSVSAATSKFKDVKANHWASNAINEAAQKGFIKGYPDGTFKPSNNITRAEFASLLAKISGLVGEPHQSKEVFSNVPSWAKEAVDNLVEAGYIDQNDYKKKPKATEAISRYEMVKWMVTGLTIAEPTYKQALDETKGTLVPFTEYYKSGIPADRIPYVAVARGTQLTVGLPDGSFGFDKPTTRAEVAVILKRYLGLLGNKADDFKELSELREVGRTGTNIMTHGAKVGLSQNDKPLFFEDIVGKEIKTKTGGTVTVHRYVVVDASSKEIVGVYANMFVDNSINRIPDSVLAFIEITYKPASEKMNELLFLSEVTSVTAQRLQNYNLIGKYGYRSYYFDFIKGKQERFWVVDLVERNYRWIDIKAIDGSAASFKFE